MSEPLADSSSRLELLLEQIMKETDPVKYDQLGAEIWRVLREGDDASLAPATSSGQKRR